MARKLTANIGHHFSSSVSCCKLWEATQSHNAGYGWTSQSNAGAMRVESSKLILKYTWPFLHHPNAAVRNRTHKLCSRIHYCRWWFQVLCIACTDSIQNGSPSGYHLHSRPPRSLHSQKIQDQDQETVNKCHIIYLLFLNSLSLNERVKLGSSDEKLNKITQVRPRWFPEWAQNSSGVLFKKRGGFLDRFGHEVSQYLYVLWLKCLFQTQETWQTNEKAAAYIVHSFKYWLSCNIFLSLRPVCPIKQAEDQLLL